MAATPVGTPQTTDFGFTNVRDNVALPSGITAGDVIFFVLVTPNAHDITASLPSGVVQIGTEQPSGAAVDSEMSVLYRVASGSEGSTFDLGAIYQTDESGGVLTFVYRGLDTADLVESVAQTFTEATSSITGPSVTPTNNNCLILQLAGADPATDPINFTPDASPAATEVFDGKIDTGNFGYVAVQAYEQATAAALALNGTFDFSRDYAHFQIALNTAAAGVTEGLPSYTLYKDGAALGNLTNVRVRVTATSALNGTQYYYSSTVAATSGVLPAIDLSATAAEVGDTVTVEILTSANEGAVFEDLVEDIS